MITYCSAHWLPSVAVWVAWMTCLTRGLHVDQGRRGGASAINGLVPPEEAEVTPPPLPSEADAALKKAKVREARQRRSRAVKYEEARVGAERQFVFVQLIRCAVDKAG